MVTVLVTFYHPGLGAIRGTVVRGIPVVAYGDLTAILQFPTEGELGSMAWAAVPVMEGEWGEAKAWELPLIPEAVAVRLAERSPDSDRGKPLYWLTDFVFPSLRQLYGGAEVRECARAFYWECQNPVEIDNGPEGTGRDDTKPRKGR